MTKIKTFPELKPPSGQYSSDPGYQQQNAPRTLPRQLVTGQLRGQQAVGGNGVIIDSDNQRITITADDGSQVGLGIIPGTTDLGFYSTDENGVVIQSSVGRSINFFGGGTVYFYDSNDELVQKIETGTRYIYDLTYGKNVMQDGKLPDGSYGWVVAKRGYDVIDGYS